MVTAETYHMRQCRCNVMFMWKVNFKEKIPVLPLRKFCLLFYLGILQRLQQLIIQFPLNYLLVVTYGGLKTKENFKLVVAVTYKRWSLIRGFQYSDLAEKLLVFWKTDCREVVTTGGSTVILNIILLKKASPPPPSNGFTSTCHDWITCKYIIISLPSHVISLVLLIQCICIGLGFLSVIKCYVPWKGK